MSNGVGLVPRSTISIFQQSRNAYTTSSSSPLGLDQQSGGQLFVAGGQSGDSTSSEHVISETLHNNSNPSMIPQMVMATEDYESKSSSDNPDAASGDEEQDIHETRRPTKKRYHRHSQYQIQEMERVFQECPHPDEKQRLELSRELKLDLRQVKFWFQNKRTQVKAQHERHDNAFLRSENEKLRSENLALRDAIANVACPTCGGSAVLADVSFDEQQLRIENVRLREEIDRISSIAAKHIGRPISAFTGSTISPSSAQSSLLNSSHHQRPPILASRHQTATSGTEVEFLAATCSPAPASAGSDNNHAMSLKTFGLQEAEKPVVAELALAAIEELSHLAQAGEPLWVVDPVTGMQVIDQEQYLRNINPASLHSNNISSNSLPAIESSRAAGLVFMDASSLVDTLMDVTRWTYMFPTIVGRALPIEILARGVAGTHDGTMQLMYAELQAASPMVSTRESYFVRYANHINRMSWLVVDVSVDRLVRANSSPLCSRCRRRPSGCLIEELSTDYCKVTWVEHCEVEEKGMHRLYQSLSNSGIIFGAQRWLSALVRRCERMHAVITNTLFTKDLAVNPTMEGRRSLLKLAERMTNNFCGGVSASVAHTWITLSPGGGSTGNGTLHINGNNSSGTLSSLGIGNNNGVSNIYSPEPASAGEDVRVLIRKSVDDPGRPPGIVLCAATSFWLPLPPSRVFDFLRDERFRAEWDILSNMGAVEEIVHVASKGNDPGNSVSLLRVNAVSTSQPNMLILQECYSDETSCLVVYAPVDVAAISVVLNGGDPDSVALLPSGFSILPDRPVQNASSTAHNNSSSSSSSSPALSKANNGLNSASICAPPTLPNSAGSILTVAFQILVDHVPTAKLSLGSVATVNNLISSTVIRIKNSLACSATTTQNL